MEVPPEVLLALVVPPVEGGEETDRVVRALELGGDDIARPGRRHGEGDQRGGHVQVQEGARHGVLAADGGHTQTQLGGQGPQEGGEGLAPAALIGAELFKILLKGEVGLGCVASGGHQLGHRIHHGYGRPPEGVPLHAPGLEAPGHDGAVVSLPSRPHGQQRGHDLGGRGLSRAAEGHQHRGRADGGVKPLHQAPLEGVLQGGGQVPQAGGAQRGLPPVHRGDLHVDVLVRAVGGEERAGEVGHGLAVPAHDHAGTLSDGRHHVGLQVFRLGMGDKGIHIRRGHHYGHALLALGNGNLRTVQTVVFLAHGVQVDGEAIGKLTDGDAHAACAEVVAAFDETGHVPIAEEPLDFPLLGGVALLNLAGHGVQRVHIVALGGAGGPADAVPAGAAAQEDYHVAGSGPLPDHVGGGGCSHHRAQLQVLCHIAGVVDLAHLAGGQANLIAVG